MSYRFTKEDLDTQYDAFLRDSVSSDESLNKYLTKPAKKNKLHWYDEDSDNDISGLSLSGKKFLKSKKVEEDGTNYENDNTKHKTKKNGYKGKSSKGKSEVSLSRDSLEDISEKSEIDNSDERRKVQEMVATGNYIETTEDDNLTLDNIINNEYNGSHVSNGYNGDDDGDKEFNGTNANKEYISSGPGIDTLDEMVDKEQFFQGLEDNADQTVDYNKLIGDISGTTYNPVDTNIHQTLNNSAYNDQHLEVPNGEAHAVSFEKDSSHQKPSMLSKVSLLDSMDSTLNTTTSPKVGGSRDAADVTGENLRLSVAGLSKVNTGTEFMGTNTSREIEDLHEAMREVGRSTATTGPQHLDSLTASQDQLVNQLFNSNKNGKERSVSEIFQDYDNIESQRNKESKSDIPDIKLLADYKTSSNQTVQHKKEYQSSVSEDVKVDGAGGFDHSHTEDTEVYQPVSAISVKDKNKQHGADHRRPTKTKNKYCNIQSSGYGRRSPSVSPIRSPGRQHTDRSLNKKMSKSSPNISRPNKPLIESALPKSRLKPGIKPNKPDDEKLLASVDSFARLIKHHISGKQLPEVKWSNDEPSESSSGRLDQTTGLSREQVLLQELKEVQQRWQTIQNENKTLKAEIKDKQKLHNQELEDVKLQHQQELFTIKQENYVLAAKNQTEVEQKNILATEGLDNVAKEKINKLEKEIKEQELLIAGYEKENQRLFSQVKNMQQNTKDTEQSMFKENQKLLRDVAQLRDELSQKEYQLKNKGIITSVTAQQQIASGKADQVSLETKVISGNQAVLGAGKISELESELKDITKQYSISQRELKVVQSTKLELEQHVDKLIREREDLSKQLQLSKSLEPEEAIVLREKYQEEIEKLNRKLKWYMENQQLLDKSAKTIRSRDLVIEKLKKQVEDSQSEAGQKLEESKQRAKERAIECKKVQDLERQVREMEQIVRRRHPNSLPAMILAAGVASGNETSDKKTPSNQVLENRIKKLEDELRNKDTECENLLRGMEQKYNTVKMQFEERIEDLESQLYRYQRPGDPVFKDYDHPHTGITALQKELENTRDRYKKQLTQLQANNTHLQSELEKSHKTNEISLSKMTYSTETELKQCVLKLQREVENKSHDNQVLQKSLDKLRKEKQQYLKTNTTDGTRKGKSKKNSRKSEEHSLDDNEEILSDNHQLILENQNLKNKVERLQLNLDQQRVDLRKSLAETEAIVRQSREDYEDKIDTLRSHHQKEFHKILAEQAVNNSTSKIVEFQSKCDAQEVLIHHLKQQLAKNEVEAEQISVLKIREANLISKLDKLKEDLVEAKRNYTPGMKHFVSIQEKIEQIERRYEKREEELQDVIKNTQNMASSELNRETEKWRNIVESKNSEIEKFRTELDSILNVIKILQQQGVLLPMAS